MCRGASRCFVTTSYESVAVDTSGCRDPEAGFGADADASGAEEALAATIFGSCYDTACSYVEHLARVASVRGLIGPREIPRLWGRHVLNSAVVADLVPRDVCLLDLGSGAGLPGIPIALARPDLTVTLLDSMQRRCDYLTEVVGEIGLAGRVGVVRSRAEEHTRRYDAVVIRAVAALPVLGPWAAALTRTGGRLLAIRGEQAQEELRESRTVLTAHGWRDAHVLTVGSNLPRPTTVVQAVRA